MRQHFRAPKSPGSVASPQPFDLLLQPQLLELQPRERRLVRLGPGILLADLSFQRRMALLQRTEPRTLGHQAFSSALPWAAPPQAGIAALLRPRRCMVMARLVGLPPFLQPPSPRPDAR